MAIAKVPQRSDAGPKNSRNMTCKTCTSCRQKKIKCDGVRPTCRDCELSGLLCSYPRDARRDSRPTRARVQGLESTVAVMLEHMRASGLALPTGSRVGDFVTDEMEQESEQDCREQAQDDSAMPDLGHDALPTPSSSTNAFEMSSQFTLVPPSCSNVVNGHVDIDETDLALHDVGRRPVATATPLVSQGKSYLAGAEEPINIDPGLSTCEARIAGVFHEHGCVSSVHGIAGIMNPTCRERHRKNISRITRKGDTAVADSKTRLISNAVLQKQREVYLYRQPQNMMDLDGCDPELAKHLLDLHFNRQHYAYLITYRPAIMDSLANGDGRWLNKLLLNAIFFSSALYSDRECLRSDPNNVQSTGSHFYQRFKQLLADAIEAPSIPSAAALLLTSASLVSQGRSSMGWNLSGTAYRMVLDLGCHMTLGPEYQNDSDDSGFRLQRDLEQEMRKRLYWGAYLTDATQALYLGRPCMLASVEARVPLQFLDTFEELEDWRPYTDLSRPAPCQPFYSAHPAHAVSTFMALARLLQISTKITELYGIQSIKLTSGSLLHQKREIERELETWRDSLPEHLQRDPDGSSAPPPHLLTPHTTYHALMILLQRAFLEEGHLRRHSDQLARKRGEEVSINSALMIQKYVNVYRTAFTLRRAPFLLSYAVYSAVTVVLRYERLDRGRFTEPICFFWTCLNELHHGCNFGLLKPLAILQDMVRELQYSASERNLPESEQLQSSLNGSLFSALNKAQNTAGPVTEHSAPTASDCIPDQWSNLPFDPAYESTTGMEGFLDDGEWNVSQDALYGLFAPSQFFT